MHGRVSAHLLPDKDCNDYQSNRCTLLLDFKEDYRSLDIFMKHICKKGVIVSDSETPLKVLPHSRTKESQSKYYYPDTVKLES